MKRLAIAALLLPLAGCISERGKDFVAEVSQYSTTDIDQAMGLAVINQDKPALQCLKAIRYVVVTIQTYVATAEKPVVGPFTALQIGMDLTNPQGYLQTECAAQKAAIRSRVEMLTAKAGALFASFGLTAGS